MDRAILEISPLFLGFVDDDVVPLLLFFFFFLVVFLLLLSPLVLFIFLIALIWQVLLQFGFVIMMLHFVTTFAIAIAIAMTYNAFIILCAFSLHTHESTLQSCLVT